MRRALVVCGLVLGLAMSPTIASANFISSASGVPASKAATVNPGNPPTATASGSTTNLSWTASTVSTGAPVTGYLITRYDSAGLVAQTISLGTCSVTVSGTSCNETAVPDGTWRYSVTPVHNSWRGAESSTTSVTVDVTAPPVPTITTNPSNPNTSPNASFAFTDTEAGVTFECKIDAGTFSPCTSPKAYSGLAIGSHTFMVRSLDAAENPSTEASYTWTINPCALVNMVSGNNFSPNAATVDVGCNVRWTNTVNATHTTTSNTGIWDSGNLTNGQTFTRQFDSAGSFPYKCTIHSSMTGTITVGSAQPDTTPPTAAITFPASGSTYDEAAWGTGCPSGICGTATDGSGSGVAQVQVSIQQGTGNYWNGSSFSSATEVLLDATGTTSWTRTFAVTNFPTDGSYTVRATATDNADNVSTAAVSTFTIDRTVDAPPPPTITANPPNPSTSPNASFSFEDSQEGVTFECRIDTGTFSECTSPKTYSGLTVGSHTFEVRAVDGAGTPSTAAVYTWTVDPCSLVSMVSGNNFSPNAITIAVGCSVRWTNTQNANHTTTSNTAVWDSGSMARDATFTHQFSSPGTYPYKCTIHASMTGTVTVN